ncbi:MAG: UPF0158 family protein [Actinomycetota bacterium]
MRRWREVEHLSEWSADCVEVAGKILSDTEDRYVEIERWRSSEGYDLMVEFTSEARDSKVRDRLSDALRGKKPFRRIKDTLFEWPEVREAWFAFQGHSQRDRTRAWLRGFGIEAVDASLYQLPSAPNRW